MSKWYELSTQEKLAALKVRLAQGLSHATIGAEYGVRRETIRNFCWRYDLKGRFRGAQPGNKNAEFHGEGRNTIMRLAKRIVTEDGRPTNICECCGWKPIEGDLPIHHIDRDRRNNHPRNLKVLCQSCHNKEHENDLERNPNGTYKKAIISLRGGIR